ncbi:unnamed protein product [Amoebophrya sp. A120]|nr:unnamed protein product [Amoebophrya sp. A120]|eukprot:GSA120T00011930001.1
MKKSGTSKRRSAAGSSRLFPRKPHSRDGTPLHLLAGISCHQQAWFCSSGAILKMMFIRILQIMALGYSLMLFGRWDWEWFPHSTHEQEHIEPAPEPYFSSSRSRTRWHRADSPLFTQSQPAVVSTINFSNFWPAHDGVDLHSGLEGCRSTSINMTNMMPLFLHSQSADMKKEKKQHVQGYCESVSTTSRTHTSSSTSASPSATLLCSWPSYYPGLASSPLLFAHAITQPEKRAQTDSDDLFYAPAADLPEPDSTSGSPPFETQLPTASDKLTPGTNATLPVNGYSMDQAGNIADSAAILVPGPVSAGSGKAANAPSAGNGTDAAAGNATTNATANATSGANTPCYSMLRRRDGRCKVRTSKVVRLYNFLVVDAPASLWKLVETTVLTPWSWLTGTAVEEASAAKTEPQFEQESEADPEQSVATDGPSQNDSSLEVETAIQLLQVSTVSTSHHAHTREHLKLNNNAGKYQQEPDTQAQDANAKEGHEIVAARKDKHFDGQDGPVHHHANEIAEQKLSDNENQQRVKAPNKDGVHGDEEAAAGRHHAKQASAEEKLDTRSDVKHKQVGASALAESQSPRISGTVGREQQKITRTTEAKPVVPAVLASASLHQEQPVVTKTEQESTELHDSTGALKMQNEELHDADPMHSHALVEQPRSSFRGSSEQTLLQAESDEAEAGRQTMTMKQEQSGEHEHSHRTTNRDGARDVHATAYAQDPHGEETASAAAMTDTSKTSTTSAEQQDVADQAKRIPAATTTGGKEDGEGTQSELQLDMPSFSISSWRRKEKKQKKPKEVSKEEEEEARWFLVQLCTGTFGKLKENWNVVLDTEPLSQNVCCGAAPGTSVEDFVNSNLDSRFDTMYDTRKVVKGAMTAAALAVQAGVNNLLPEAATRRTRRTVQECTKAILNESSNEDVDDPSPPLSETPEKYQEACSKHVPSGSLRDRIVELLNEQKETRTSEQPNPNPELAPTHVQHAPDVDHDAISVEQEKELEEEVNTFKSIYPWDAVCNDIRNGYSEYLDGNSRLKRIRNHIKNSLAAGKASLPASRRKDGAAEDYETLFKTNCCKLSLTSRRGAVAYYGKNCSWKMIKWGTDLVTQNDACVYTYVQPSPENEGDTDIVGHLEHVPDPEDRKTLQRAAEADETAEHGQHGEEATQDRDAVVDEVYSILETSDVGKRQHLQGKLDLHGPPSPEEKQGKVLEKRTGEEKELRVVELPQKRKPQPAPAPGAVAGKTVTASTTLTIRSPLPSAPEDAPLLKRETDGPVKTNSLVPGMKTSQLQPQEDGSTNGSPEEAAAPPPQASPPKQQQEGRPPATAVRSAARGGTVTGTSDESESATATALQLQETARELTPGKGVSGGDGENLVTTAASEKPIAHKNPPTSGIDDLHPLNHDISSMLVFEGHGQDTGKAKESELDAGGPLEGKPGPMQEAQPGAESSTMVRGN